MMNLFASSIFFTILPIAVSFAIVFVVLSGIAHYQGRKHKKRQSPLTSKLLRSPGYALIQEADEISIDIAAHMFGVLIFPLFIYASHISNSYFANSPETTFRILINVIAVIAIEVFLIREIIQLGDKRKRLREGYEAESAVGSELNHLMLDGARVFHDLQAENFNLDHVIVSTRGVFCVETKSRVKYFEADAKQGAKLDFDGKSLKFPSHIETEPVEQVKMNCKWLKDWLSQAVGEPVEVRPVLVFPGWYVTTTARTEIIVLNGKNCRGFFEKISAKTFLTPEQVQRISYQIEQRCRDIEPNNYRKTVKPIGSK